MPLAAAADRLCPSLWPFCPRQNLPGVHLAATDHLWHAGEGLRIEGLLPALLLLLTGRRTALTHLSGPGLRTL